MVEAGSAREWVWCCGHRVSGGICDGPGIGIVCGVGGCKEVTCRYR